MTPRNPQLSYMDLFFCGAIGIVGGILIGHAQAKDDYRTCWDAMKDKTLAERVTECSPILTGEWTKTKKGWKQ